MSIPAYAPSRLISFCTCHPHISSDTHIRTTRLACSSLQLFNLPLLTYSASTPQRRHNLNCDRFQHCNLFLCYLPLQSVISHTSFPINNCPAPADHARRSTLGTSRSDLPPQHNDQAAHNKRPEDHLPIPKAVPPITHSNLRRSPPLPHANDAIDMAGRLGDARSGPSETQNRIPHPMEAQELGNGMHTQHCSIALPL
ncbi:hypothetical protein BS47DRAFT_1082175 [Hydnum rufescens UP504]|uniref:Uncharacterized protein n=1 Tax=Hydnum rufescens UP504 TaxID=1448309 RepID=A0A9P6B913_9AGAM|nr:hypothetical protein BS47DRAFT_1082175 [Hydnum rufescens UP504]